MKICSVCKRCFDDAAASCPDAGHPPLSVVRKGDPLMVPGYAMERLLGSPAKVDIYQAQRLDCGRNCLVKIVSADAQNRESFLRDAGRAAMVFDARLADIYESGTLPSGEAFVVEEDVEGQTTLRRQLASSGVPDLLTSIRIVEQIAETLHVLHINGLTHGAVRPENIVVDHAPDGLPIVRLCNIDLGGVIAQNTIANKFLIDSATQAIRYFAPEQCSGQPLSPQTDIYSLGVVFFELLAGVPPFDAPKATALIEMHRSHRPPEIKIEDFELRMLVTHSLSESLQKQPSFRQSSADLFARQMRHIEQLATHVSTPPPAVGAPAAPPRITPPAVYSPAPAPMPVADLEIVEDHPQLDNELTEAVNAPDAETVEFFYLVDNEPVLAPEVAFEPESEPLQIEPAETRDESAAESALPERSSLVERRHSLKLLMKQTHPPQTAVDEAPLNAPPAFTSEVNDEPAMVPDAKAFEPGVFEEIHAEPDVKPKLIEWEQPDDIPSLDEIEIEPEMGSEPAAYADSAPDASAAPDEPHASRLAAQTHFIEWEQPEDDIPSIEEVIEARQNMEAAAARAIQFDPEDADVAAVLHERVETETRIPAPTPLVTPGKEVRAIETINFDFVPTLLGDKKERTRPEPREHYTSIFTSYEPVNSPPRTFPYRSFFIGLGLMTVAAILGLGGDPVWRYFSEPEKSEPVAAAAAPVAQVPLAARSDRTIGDESPSPDSEPPTAFSNSDPVYEAPDQVTPKRTTAAPAVKPPKAVRSSAPVSDPPARPDASAFSPSTVVITYGSGNVRRTDPRQGRTQEGASRSAESSMSGATRPRVVQVPPNR